MKKIVFFLILCLNFSCNNLEKKQSKVEIPYWNDFHTGR